MTRLSSWTGDIQPEDIVRQVADMDPLIFDGHEDWACCFCTDGFPHGPGCAWLAAQDWASEHPKT